HRSGSAGDVHPTRIAVRSRDAETWSPIWDSSVDGAGNSAGVTSSRYSSVVKASSPLRGRTSTKSSSVEGSTTHSRPRPATREPGAKAAAAAGLMQHHLAGQQTHHTSQGREHHASLEKSGQQGAVLARRADGAGAEGTLA